MSKELISQVLRGDSEAIAVFGGSDYCVVIDWRDQLDEVVNAFSAFLTGDKLLAEEVDEDTFRIHYGQKSVEAKSGLKHEELFLVINCLLSPDFEARQFRPYDGDTYSLYLAPSETWLELEQVSPEAVEKYFLNIERLAAYWGKSYWARLFSKP